jgi:PAS domain S-box-containing protein
MRNLFSTEVHPDQPAEHDISLLVTHCEEELNRITRLAASYFSVHAFFTVIDSRGGRIKASSDHQFDQSIEQLLSHGIALMKCEELLVPNMLQDSRFASHPAVSGASQALRFYASAAVYSLDNTVLGSLTLLDGRPRDFPPEQIKEICDYAKIISNVIAATQTKYMLLKQTNSERSIRELMDYLPEGVLMLSEDGTITSCNVVAEKMYGSSTEGLVGLSSRTLTADDPERLGQLLQAGIVDQIQATARRVDGSEFPVEFSVKILDPTKTRRYALIVRDISVRKEEERRAQIADTRRRDYFVTATHELRTPMASVLGFSELLLQRHFDPVEGRQLIEIVHRQASRLVNLINEMLDLARIESGGTTGLNLCVLDASTLLDVTVSGLRGLGANRQISIRSGSDLPMLKADPSKLQQALTNIISNAIKYSDDKSKILIESFETSMDRSAAIGFRVTDQGIGMTSEEQAQIYKPFFRAPSILETSGTGLGMTIFKEIIDLHRGSVEIQSTPGKGTSVTFVLPAMPSTE